MKLQPTSLEGAYVIQLPHSEDNRGSFTKTFNAENLQAVGIDFVVKESYYSLSHKDVIRGMHFQLPPHQHAKLVSCPIGGIIDVIVDLRKASATYGQSFSANLSAENSLAMYVPEGFAHGFLSLSDNTITNYLVSTGYHQDSDNGIAHDSFGFNWPTEMPILSDRDKEFIDLGEFKSPF